MSLKHRLNKLEERITQPMGPPKTLFIFANYETTEQEIEKLKEEQRKVHGLSDNAPVDFIIVKWADAATLLKW